MRQLAGTLSDPIGPVAQSGRAPPWHGGGPGFKSRQVHLHREGFMLGGFVAGEGSFIVTRRLPPFADGTPRLRFVFEVTVATRDRTLLHALRDFLEFGSITDRPPTKPGWQPTSTFHIGSMHGHRNATIPFAESFLLPCAKRSQFELWRTAFIAWEHDHPSRYGKGPSTCSEAGCEHPVRGRGLCRIHYYRATGY